MSEPAPDEPAAVFVYGTLMPGRLRWPVLEQAAVTFEPATVAGALYDTGQGYPAARFDEAGAVPGWLVALDPARRDRTIDLLDHIEGDEYRRVRIVTADGRGAYAYAWIGPRESLVPVSTWEADVGDER